MNTPSNGGTALRAMALLGGVLLGANTATAAVEISGKPTSNMTCSAGVCAPTAKKAVLNVGDLEAMLASENVTVKSTSLSQDIVLDAKLSWANTHGLTLDSYRSIGFDKPVTVLAAGALTITTNDGGSDGDYRFLGKSHAEFRDVNSMLVINGQIYVLVNNAHVLKQKILANHAGSFALARSYDATGDKAYQPIPVPLAGNFDGLGNEIKNIQLVTKRAGGGFFSTTTSKASIRDLNVTGISISTNSDSAAVGGLVGYNAGTIQSVSITGTMRIIDSYDAFAGLLVGGGDGTIRNSFASGTIDAGGSRNTYVGGLVGGGSYIFDSHASVDIKNTNNASSGGLVGFGYMISDCYATGNVSGSEAGGLVGKLSGQIIGSFATGTVQGYGVAGGLVGTSDRGEPDTYIINSYSKGAASAFSYVGGLIGYKDAYLQQVYSLGAPSGGVDVGGLIGYEGTGYGINTAAYWDIDSSGVSNPHQGAGTLPDDPGVAGLSDLQMKSGLPAGFDPAVWAINPTINSGYPYLLANPPPN